MLERMVIGGVLRTVEATQGYWAKDERSVWAHKAMLRGLVRIVTVQEGSERAVGREEVAGVGMYAKY